MSDKLHAKKLIFLAAISAFFFFVPFTSAQWWNSSWLYRAPINITNNNITQTLEQGYTVNITFNHSALVQQGKSLASGNDVRILWHDSTPWWNNSWNYRKKITITNNNLSQVLEQNYTVNITLDTTGSKFVAAGNDTRIVWWNGTNNIELDRINTTAFNAVNTSIWFKLQKNISANSWDDNYYVYYGNPSAGSPLQNGSNVYLFYDDFDTVPTTWISPHGSGMSGAVTLSQPSAGIVRVSGASGIRDTATPAFSSITRFVLEAKVVDIQQPDDEEPAYFIFYNSASTYVKWGRYQSSGEGRILPVNAGTGSQKASTYYGSGNTLKIIYNGSAYLFYINDALVSTETGLTLIGITSVGFGGYDFDTSWYNDWDYLRVRKYLSPEPSASLGAEQGQSRYIELDRVNTTAFNNAAANTVLWFKTQTNIPAGGSGANYSLYYGNPSAGAAPQNGSNVYLFYDDLDAGNTQLTEVDNGNRITFTNNRIEFATVGQESYYVYKQLVPNVTDFVFEYTIQTTSGSSCFDLLIGLGTAIGQESASGVNTLGGQPVSGQCDGLPDARIDFFSPETYSSSTITLSNGVTYYFRFIRLSSTATLYVFSDAARTVQVTGSPITLTSSNFPANFAYVYVLNGHVISGRYVSGWSDDYKLRKYLSPEPSAALGTEQIIPVEWSLNASSIPSVYSSAQSQFNITWKSKISMGSALLESNFSGSPKNYSMNYPGNPWWSSDYSYRQPINITNNNLTQTLEQGYTVNITFNHSALVQAGKSLASGNDVRITWYDSAPWWNSSWNYRKKITMTNNNLSQVLEQNYTVNLTFDMTQLVNAGRMNATGNDTRIVWWNGTSNVELDRILEPSSAGGFDGSDDWVSGPSNSQLALTSSNITIEAWIYPRSLTGVIGIVGYSGNSETQAVNIQYYVGFGFNGVNGRFGYAHEYSAGSNQIVETSGTNYVQTNEWTHIAITRDIVNKQIRFWVNGRNVENGTYTTAPDGGTSSQLNIGNVDTASYFFNGFIDELRISNTTRYTTNFTPSRNYFTPDINTIGLFHFDNTTSTQVWDSSGNANHGTQTNGAYYTSGFIVPDSYKQNTLWFKLQKNISANSWNDNYYVYYGNPSAGVAPANGSNVYLFYDDFEDGDLAGWTVTGSAVNSNADSYSGSRSVAMTTTTDSIKKAFNIKPIIIEFAGKANSISGDYWGGQRDDADTSLRVCGGSSDDSNLQCYDTTYRNIGAGTWNTNWHTWKIRISSSAYDFAYDNNAPYFTGTGDTTINQLKFHMTIASGTVFFDNVKVRKYISPEPSASLGTEQGQSRYVELDRVNTTAFNNATNLTVVWFKTQTNILAGGSDANYSLYYGNPSAGAAPADGSNVWLADPTFSSGWTVAGPQASKVSLSNNKLVHSDIEKEDQVIVYRDISGITSYQIEWARNLSSWAAEYRDYQAVMTSNTNILYGDSMTNHNAIMQCEYCGPPGGYYLNGNPNNPNIMYYDSSNNVWYYHRVIKNNTGYYVWVYSDDAKTNLLASTSSTNDNDFTFIRVIAYSSANSPSAAEDNGYGEIKDFRFRKYISPEPSAALGAEQNVNQSYTFSEVLPAGSFYWKSYANNSAGAWNSSDTWYFSISKAPTLVRLWLNGTEKDKSYQQNSTANFTATVNITRTVYLQTDLPGWVLQSGTGTVINLTSLNSTGKFNITAYFPADQNYSASSQTYFAIVTIYGLYNTTVNLILHLGLQFADDSLETGQYVCISDGSGWFGLIGERGAAKAGNISADYLFNSTQTSDDKVFLAASKGTCTTFRRYVSSILAKTFLSPLQAFAYAKTNLLQFILQYPEADLLNDLHWGRGAYQLFISNQGYNSTTKKKTIETGIVR